MAISKARRKSSFAVDGSPIIITEPNPIELAPVLNTTDSARATFKATDPGGFNISYDIKYFADSSKLAYTNDSSNLPPHLLHPAQITTASDSAGLLATYRFLTRTADSDGSGNSTVQRFLHKYIASDGLRNISTTKAFQFNFVASTAEVLIVGGGGGGGGWGGGGGGAGAARYYSAFSITAGQAYTVTVGTGGAGSGGGSNNNQAEGVASVWHTFTAGGGGHGGGQASGLTSHSAGNNGGSGGGGSSSSSSTETTNTSTTNDPPNTNTSNNTENTGDTTDAFTMKQTTEFCEDVCDGLVAYYPFFGNANDTSGNGFNGEFPIGATPSEFFINDRDNNSDSSFRFNGSDILIRDLIDREMLGTSFTISTIVKIDQNKTDYKLDEFGDPWFSELRLLDSNSLMLSIFFWANLKQQIAIHLNDYNKSIFSQNLDATEHNHIAVTFDKEINLFQIFINGKVTDSVAENATLLLTGNIKIKSDWFGSMDELRIYNRALSENEIQQIIGQ